MRSRADAAYLDDLATMLGDRLVVHASDEGQRLDLDALFASVPKDALALFCGPMRMLDAARHAWIGAGHPLPDLRYETFGSSGTLPTETFRVRLKGSDVELEIPRERSMLDVLNASGHDVMYDCKRGECGLCAIDVVEVDGEIDHRDVFFSDHQKQSNQKICACVSRARGHHHGGHAAAGGRGLRRGRRRLWASSRLQAVGARVRPRRQRLTWASGRLRRRCEGAPDGQARP